MLYILDFYVIDKRIVFADTCFEALTSIGADYDGTQETKPTYVDVICPKCRYTEIADVQSEQIPRRHQSDTRMVLRELLKEGKSYWKGRRMAIAGRVCQNTTKGGEA